MISYARDPQQTIPESSIKIVGLGGAGANMLDRAALDGLAGAEMLCINSDVRTLSSSVASEKIQIGSDLTKGLGAGGDPEVGLKAAHEAEQQIRDSFRDRKMVFLCVGLGGGTGSGAAPFICRLAREQGAFVVVFATMPFTFEGGRRREQAETSLNELAVLANALVTFDNNRMGELVVAKQGIHEAFAAADHMISESVQAVTRLVMRPGLIHVGLDDLMSALSTTRSRCLFGSGIAEGENRIQLALENTLASPLLDQGSLLADAATVLVHICGGENLTLYEVELLMQGLSKHVPDTAHILFGAAVDPSMGDSLSITLVSALPESKLISRKETSVVTADSIPEPVATDESSDSDEALEEESEERHLPELVDLAVEKEDESELELAAEEQEVLNEMSDEENEEDDAVSDDAPDDSVADEEDGSTETEEEAMPSLVFEQDEIEEDDINEEAVSDEEELPTVGIFAPDASGDDSAKLVGSSKKNPQGELELDGGPKGKFEGETPNFLDGEDLDIPPFLRKKRR